MATRCTCESCQLFRTARQIGEDIDSLIGAVADVQERRGPDDQIVVDGWKLIDQMDAQMQAAHQRAKALARRQIAEHVGAHTEWVRGA